MDEKQRRNTKKEGVVPNYDIKLCRQEIATLTKLNFDLIQKLKRMSEEIEAKIMRHKTKKQDEEEPELKLGRLQEEKKCLDKMVQVYEKEVEHLKYKLSHETGYNKVLELDTKLSLCQEEEEKMLKQLRDLKKMIKDNEKKIQSENFKKENGVTEQEVG